jgi:GR25 family glycosyltransferase involved in LPS biosynthesis
MVVTAAINKLLDDRLIVVVIATPGSDRKKPLIESLATEYSIQVIEVSATMLKSDSPELQSINAFDFALSKLIYGRDLAPGEYGCSISNTQARELLAATVRGGVVLEDDARIKDVSEFVRVAKNFLSSKNGTEAILSFYDGGDYQPRIKSTLSLNRSWIRVLGHTSFTVAYAITPRACRSLVDVNTPIVYLADWPPTAAKYYLHTQTLVRHGDDNTGSLISNSGVESRLRPNLLLRIKILTFAYFFVNRKAGLTFYQFFFMIWLPRLLHYINNLNKSLFLRRGSESEK